MVHLVVHARDALPEGGDAVIALERSGRGDAAAPTEGAGAGWLVLSVLLPMTDPTGPVSAGAGGSAATPPTRPTVLLVEDEPALRRMVVRILERGGYRVRAADSPDEALELAGNADEPIALLLTDVVMPGTSGPKVAERFARLRPHTPVLFMSGYAPDGHGAFDEAHFLAKPFKPDALIAKVAALLSAPGSGGCAG